MVAGDPGNCKRRARAVAFRERFNDFHSWRSRPLDFLHYSQSNAA
jgi:hypothetical protein